MALKIPAKSLAKIGKKKKAALSRKIKKLRGEGMPQKQAVAVALSMLGLARKKKRKK